MVKHQIDVKVLVFGANLLLPGDKREAFAQFKQKRLQIVEQTLFQTGFQKPLARQVKKVKDIRIADIILGG
jgi:hypothetical protein